MKRKKFEKLMAEYEQEKQEKQKPRQEKKPEHIEVNKKLEAAKARFLKFAACIVCAFISLAFCIEDEGWLGAAIYIVQDTILGDARFLLPFILIGYGLLRFKFRRYRKGHTLANVLIVAGIEICTVLAYWGNGGMLGYSIHYMLTNTLGNGVSIALISLIVILTVIYTRNIINQDQKVVPHFVPKQRQDENNPYIDDDTRGIRLPNINLVSKTGKGREIQRFLDDMRIEATVMGREKCLNVDRYAIKLVNGAKFKQLKSLESELAIRLGDDISINPEGRNIYVDIFKPDQEPVYLAA